MASVVATVVCALALVGLLQSERSGSTRGRYVTKPLASAAFIVIALTRGALGGESYGLWIAIGLVLGAVGDVALMFRSDRAFLAGLVVFLLGHVAYVVAFAMVIPPAAWLAWTAIPPLLAAAVVLRWLWPHLGALRMPVIGYVVVITTMTVAALAAQRGPVALGVGQARMLTVGAVLFFASDIAVARERFVASGFVNGAWGLPAYYGGQCLLAWSVA